MNPDVLIVGAGPVGLTMASELARFGLSVRIIDKNDGATDKSKAIVIWPRTLELMDRMAPGCTGRFLAAGLQALQAKIQAGREEIAVVDLTHVDSPYNYTLMIPQSDTERLLEEHLRSQGVAVERRTELKDFDAHPAGVSCTLRHASGIEERVETAWLIGCDGAHSTVRHRLGMEFEGDTLLNDWVLADVHLQGQTLPGPSTIVIFWHADGPLALFPIGPSRYRIIADAGRSQKALGESSNSPTIEDVQRILDTRGPGGISVSDSVWLSTFTINERKVADYRSGRIFVAGDAAHVHSPAGGQGMNTGMQDAFNLAWKLALVARGLCASEPLLSSYSSERGGVAKLVLEATGKATAMAVLQGGVQQTIRNHVASWLFGFAPVRHTMANVLSELSIGYPRSALNEISSHAPGGPEPGKRAPVESSQNPVGAGSTPRFAVFTDEAALPQDLLQQHASILDPAVRAPFRPGGLWLVRPDGYVALATRSGDWTLVRRYLDHLSSARA